MTTYFSVNLGQANTARCSYFKTCPFCTMKNNTQKEFVESAQVNGCQYPCPAALLMFLSSVLNPGAACYQSRGTKSGKL